MSRFLSCSVSRPNFRSGNWIVALTVAATAVCLVLPPAPALGEPTREQGWSGNFAKNPGFEEDFVNTRAEGHVLSFKGDWFYNQKDLLPDYWSFGGGWSWESKENARNGGGRYLKLASGASATQSYPGASYQEGGSAWGGAGETPIKVANPATVAARWRAAVWVRGGGSITLGGATFQAPAQPNWQRVTIELPADRVDPAKAMVVSLAGPGEFDDLVVQEQLPSSPNLIPNAGFEQADEHGAPAGFSPQRKYRHIGPTYYVWTDWNHAFRETRGPVTVDKLVSYAGKASLRFDVYPGDEKYIESDAIALNQSAPGVIEVAAYVRADRIKLIDIRCVNEDGADLKGYYPIQPENTQPATTSAGGTATWGNGTFEWRYLRKFFAAPFDQPLKSVRVRLCARGFNGQTLDDSGTRSYACQTGTVWWDNLYVTERGTSVAALAGRGVKTFPVESIASGPIGEAQLDLGQRLYGANRVTYSFANEGAAGNFALKLTTKLPGGEPMVTRSAPVAVANKRYGRLEVPYEIKRLAGDVSRQGELHVELERDGARAADALYAFNTWPVVVDFDVARSYNLPQENPVTTSLNLGVSDETLAKTKTLEIGLAKASDPSRITQRVSALTDLRVAFAETASALPRASTESYEFNLPTPGWWTDRTNLLVLKLDLGSLKVWPHDQPTRDTVLVARGLDAAGNELFSEKSDPFGRMSAPPPQPPISSVEVRADGAVLINGQPRYFNGATHQNARTSHTPAIQAQLGLMGLRLVHGGEAEFQSMAKLWTTHNLYVHQAKPISGQGSVDNTVEMTQEQKNALAAFVASGGMQNIVSVNTGGWEGHIPETPDARAKHQATNDFVYQTTKRPLSWSHSGAANAWNTPTFPYYDINFAETEMWGPMEYNVIWTPYLKRQFKRPSTWVYLPQLYDNHPFERYRFETYENIIRGSAGVAMIQGIGDPTFNRGLAGELRYLEGPLNSLETAPDVTFEPNVSHKVTRHKGKTYILATNCGPIHIGNWKWDTSTHQSGEASHEGDTANMMWSRPAGIRIHGFRGMPMPELIQKGDKIVQYVWLDARETPDWAMVAVRGDGKFIHNAVLGNFDFAKFRSDLGNIIMYSELNHSVWHEINWVFDTPTYQMAVKLMGQQYADSMKKTWDEYRAKVDELAYQAGHFKRLGDKPRPGQWHRIEIDADEFGLVGKLVDGFAYMTQNGRALWDYSVLERGGKVARVFCEDTVGIDRRLLDKVRINVPGLRAGMKVKSLFDQRELAADANGFTDDFQGVDTYQYEGWAVEGDMFGYVKDPNRELPRMMPSGYGYKYGPTQVRIYEISY